jgi:hypothetical protein
MHDVFGMQFSDSQCNLSSIETDCVLAESLFRLENFVQFSSLDERHDEVEPQL